MRNIEMYVVVFGMGGRENTVWRAITTYRSLDMAVTSANRLVRAGRPAYVKTKKEVELLGLPVGPAPLWDYGNLCWKEVPSLGVGCES